MSKSFKRNVLIVDGSHYLYRAYFGVPDSARLPSGLQVNAVYGFFAYLRKTVGLLSPDLVFTVFDSETGISDKTQVNSDYKADRLNLDTGMYKQLPIIKKLLTLIDIPFIEPENHEADDYISSLAMKYSKSSKVYIFSNDKDFLQVIGSNISLVKIGKKTPETINEESFIKDYGFECRQYLDYLSLKGDSSDNIPGIPGIGHKTAQSLVSQYGDIDSIYQNLHLLSSRLCSMLSENKEIAYNNKKFLRIDMSVDIESSAIELPNNSYSKLMLPTNSLLSQIGIK